MFEPVVANKQNALNPPDYCYEGYVIGKAFQGGICMGYNIWVPSESKIMRRFSGEFKGRPVNSLPADKWGRFKDWMKLQFFILRGGNNE